MNGYNTALYLRLSHDDGENRESESIHNQREFLLKYVTDNNLSLVDIYIDDGWTGTNFDRPDFQRMIRDVEAGKINCIITKDLSRLGRDYIMTGHYLEKYFPEHGVRYIAVNDGVDTFENSTNNDMTPFRAVFNDMYAKDISKKVRTALNTKKQNGEFIGSVPPYGYKKDPSDKYHLVIDEETAHIVRRIYSMYIEGYSTVRIAAALTAEGVPTPSQVKNLTATQLPMYKGVWNNVIIRRILQNPTYIGNVTQNWSRKINYKIDKQRKIPKDERITVSGTHEAIISESDFELAQTIMQKRSYQPVRKCKEHRLAGLLICADCGKRMTFQSDRGERIYAVCATYRRYRKTICTAHYMREDYLEQEIVANLKEHARKYLDTDKIVKSANDSHEQIDSLSKTSQSLEHKLEEFSKTITNAYIDKSKGFLSERDFSAISASVNADRERIAQQLEDIKRQINKQKNTSQDNEATQTLLKEFLTFDEMPRNIFAALIDKVVINSDKTFQIYYNFHI